ncbi:hypothetical protein [Brevundimonas sp.]
MADVPDRCGWVDEPLASLPAIPPFPELTDFERRTLSVIAKLFGPNEAAFLQQVEAARVTDRIDTVVGFYTRIAMDRATVTALPITHKGAHFEVPGTRYGMLVTLWDDDGYLAQIEGVTYGEDDMGGQKLADLDFTGFQLS